MEEANSATQLNCQSL